MPQLSTKIRFKTARSGGKGGQNVNKVETMVEGFWNIEASSLTADEKERIRLKLGTKINSAGELVAKSQEARTQLANKELVIKKMTAWVERALIVPKKRKATKPTGVSKEKRLDSKKKNAQLKESRKKLTHGA